MIKIDSSSLIVALKMDFILVLSKLYSKLVITNSVYHEVILRGEKKGKEDAIIGKKLIEDNIIHVHKVKEDLMELKLGKGETEIIHNSINLKCPCMMEDKKAKKIAESFDLDVRRIPISILEAFHKKIIDSIKYEAFLTKWIKYANPSYEEVYFIKKIKELLR